MRLLHSPDPKPSLEIKSRTAPVLLLMIGALLSGCGTEPDPVREPQEQPLPANLPQVSIGTASPANGNSSTTFQFPVAFTQADSIHLSADHVILGGAATTGCSKSVSGSGTSSRIISITGCQGNGPLTVSIAGGAASGAEGSSLASTLSSAVIVSNPETEVAITGGTGNIYTGGSGRQVTYELYYPTNPGETAIFPIYIQIHGGGWTGGDSSTNTSLATTIAKKGFIVANINYTLAPSYSPGSVANTPYSAGFEDVLAFVNFITHPDSLSMLHGDPNRVSIGGFSAGAHLALVQATRTENPVNFKCVVDMAGPANLTPFNPETTLQESIHIVRGVFGNNPPLMASPALNAGGFKAEKLLVLHAEQDSIVPISQTLELVTQLQANRPEVAITRNYWPNPNANPTVAHHVITLEQVTSAAASFLSSQCKSILRAAEVDAQAGSERKAR